jgi:hypothetical protein
MTAKPKLVAPYRTSERERLGVAIAGAQRAVENNRKAIERAEQMVAQASARFERAQAKVEEAKTIDAERMAKAARMGAAPAASIMRDARQAEQTAEDEFVATRAAVDALREKQKQLDADHAATERAVQQAVAGVVKSETDVRALVNDAERLTVELVRKRCLLRELFRDGLVSDEVTASALAVLRADLPREFGAVEYVRWSEHPAALAWREMQARLAADADAVLDEFY